ncbi:HNH endonuclease family protein [Mycolicibacterium sp.]|uniref:HNH endonuclease family protein n=1 Tax=Mycolicibacterium sp. TaxID=2320850 RepID=UPI00355DD473
MKAKSALRKISSGSSELKQFLITLAVIVAAFAAIGAVVRGPDSARELADTAIGWSTGKIQDLLDSLQPSAGEAITPGVGGTGTPSADATALTVAAPGSMNGYARDRFGQAWTDDVDVEGGRNGCDTRNDILRRDLTGVALTGGCKVMSGTLVDPYTATVISFVRGKDTSSLVQVDHIVALANAWVSGASGWDLAQLKRIANDPLNLMAVDGSTNMAKGASSADQWLPPNPGFQCLYVKRQVMVKNKYRLTVTQQEKAEMLRWQSHC